jgi:hypothetical protein
VVSSLLRVSSHFWASKMAPYRRGSKLPAGGQRHTKLTCAEEAQDRNKVKIGSLNEPSKHHASSDVS